VVHHRVLPHHYSSQSSSLECFPRDGAESMLSPVSGHYQPLWQRHGRICWVQIMVLRTGSCRRVEVVSRKLQMPDGLGDAVLSAVQSFSGGLHRMIEHQSTLHRLGTEGFADHGESGLTRLYTFCSCVRLPFPAEFFVSWGS
jgi:hypothetical protein